MTRSLRHYVIFVIFCAAGLLSLSPLPATAQPARDNEPHLALVIGNSRYKEQPLPNPVNDARAMTAALKELGFDVELVTDASTRQMQRAIVEFGRKLRAGGVGLFYYAGHGLQVKGQNYLVPVDATIDSEASVRFEGVPVEAITDQMTDAGNRVNIVVLDACRNNPFERRLRGGTRGLAAVDAARGMLVAYATAPGSVAADGDDNNGLYTSELLKAIKQPGLKAEEVFKRVRAAVLGRSGGAQLPWESSSLTGEFVFKPMPVAMEAPVVPTPAPAPAPPVPAPLSIDPGELAFWDAVKQSTNPADYRAYLEAFPNGRFAALARARGSPRPQPQLQPEAQPPPPNIVEREGRNNAAPQATSPSAALPSAPGGVPPRTAIGGIAKPPPMTAFRDCEQCPIMVALPTGGFEMGARNLSSAERPTHRVTIAKPLAFGKHEVSFTEWDACVAGSGCNGFRPDDHGWGRGSRPVVGVSWEDAAAYTRWLSQKTGQRYRLPSEAEWEYAARAGTSAAYWWGEAVERGRANCLGCGSRFDGKQTAPADAFDANPFGLVNMLGNAAEWVADCWGASYAGAPADGSAVERPRCGERVLRGGAFNQAPDYATAASRFKYEASVRYYAHGFRVAKDLP